MPIKLQLKFKLAVSIAALLLSVIVHAEDFDVDPQTGYRMDHYRAPVPQSVPGGVTVETPFVKDAHANGNIVFIDVLPPRGMGADPIDGFWLITEPRLSIAGSVWLPEVGQGFLDAEREDYFRRNLIRLTGNDKSKPIMFFCTADCWQSWNAATRAISWGYTGVHWYPNGSDGWLENGNNVVEIAPVNFIDDTTPILFPQQANIELITSDGQTTRIGSVSFKNQPDGSATFSIDMDGADFTDHFLSMRPFKCITGGKDWYCYLAYPYKLRNTITPDDLTDLEYNLLFITKSKSEFGIDAWNGIYYQLDLNENGEFTGALSQGDLNVLQSPPEPYSHPINQDEFYTDDAAKQRFPTVNIRP